MKKKTKVANTVLKMVGEELLVTPEMAEQFLQVNMPGSRTVSPKHVDELVHDMEKGTWRRSPQPICFDTEGRLIDGQRRLQAIAITQKPQLMMVVRNCPKSCIDHLDCGRQRSIVTRIRMGYPELNWISTKATSVCNILQSCWRQMMPTQDDKAKYMIQHKDALLWVMRTYRATGTGVEKASIRSAIMVAYEAGVDGQLLVDLCNILADPGAVAASGDLADQNFHQLRNYLIARTVRFNSGGNENRTVFYIVGQAIQETSQGMKLSNLDKVARFPFSVTGLNNEVVYKPSKFPPILGVDASNPKAKKGRAPKKAQKN